VPDDREVVGNDVVGPGDAVAATLGYQVDTVVELVGAGAVPGVVTGGGTHLVVPDGLKPLAG
jgi:hypothetical protein